MAVSLTSQDTLEQWLRDLGEAVFGTPVGLSRLGIATLLFGNDAELIIQLLPDDRVAIYSELIDAEEIPTADTLRMMLVENFLGKGTGGATLSVNPESNMITIAICLPITALNYDTFSSLVVGIADQAMDWQNRLRSAIIRQTDQNPHQTIGMTP